MSLGIGPHDLGCECPRCQGRRNAAAKQQGSRNIAVSQNWITNTERLISAVQRLCESAHDGRPLPEWLEERLKVIEKLLEEI